LKNEIIEKSIKFPDEIEYRKLKCKMEFLKPKPPNEITADFIKNEIFDRQSLGKPHF